MKRHFKIIIAGLLYFMASALSANAQNTDGKPETVKPPRSGGELAVALGGKPLHLNSAIASGILTGIPAAQIFAFLLRLDHNWEYQPYLAERWDISPDGLAVTFHLRSGATFHNGRPVTSEDVAFSLLTIQKHHPFSDMLAAIENVDAHDPLTAVVRLKRPHPALLMALASPMTPILPKHVYGDGRDIKTHPANLKPVGSGPFQFVSFTDKEIVLEKYPGFFLSGKPYLDKLIFKIIKKIVLPVMLETDSVQLAEYADTENLRNAMNKLGNHRILYTGYEGIGGMIWLAFNLRRPPLDDVRVRRAFAYTIDRDFLVKTIFGGNVKNATGPISSDLPFYSDNVNKYSVNTDLANKLLDEAGYPRNDKGVRFTLTLAPLPATYSGFSEYLQSVLSRKLGVEIKILNFENIREWAKMVANGDFELATDAGFNWGDPVIGVNRTYSSRNIRPGVIWSNTQAYRNPVVDELMDKAGAEMNVTRRKALYAEFQKQVVDDLPVFWLYHLPYRTALKRGLLGVEKASVWGLAFPFTDVYWNNKVGNP